MTRLFTTGFEEADLKAAGTPGFGVLPAINTTAPVRSGAYSVKCGTDASGNRSVTDFGVPTAVTGRSYFTRTYVNITNLPTAAANILGYYNNGGTGSINLVLTPTGTLRIVTTVSGQIGVDTAALTTGTWYRIELRAKVGVGATDEVELKIDGVTEILGTGVSVGDGAPDRLFFGYDSGAGNSKTIIFDDFAVNDDQGAAQNTWPGEGKIVNLVPTTDSARGANWYAGASGTTNLWNAVDNAPPVGLASGSATITSQIRNATSDATGNYDATLTTYTAAGIGANDTIRVIHPIAMVGCSSNTATAGGLAGVSNPAITEAAIAFPQGGIAGTHPTNWGRVTLDAQADPTVTLGTAPVYRIGKRASTNRVGMAEYLAYVVEYEPSSVVSHPLTGSIAGTAIVSGSLAVIAASHPLTGSVAGAATITGTRITTAQPLTASVAGAATIAATRITEAQPLAGSVAGGATITATGISLAHPLTGSITASGSVAGQRITVTHPLIGNVAGTSTIAASRVALAHPLSGTVAGSATITGTRITASHPLTGSVTGTATLTAAISGAPSSHPLTGAVAGTSTITASQISEAQPLTGSVTGQASVTVARLVMDHALVGLVPGMASITGLITMAQPLDGAIAGVTTIAGQLSGPVVSYPWPATVTFTAVGGPAVSLTAVSSPSAQPDAIADAPAVSLSAISVLTVTLAGVSDGPATVLGSLTGSTASIVSIATPDGAWTAIADTVDISGVVPGPDATISVVALPGSTFTAVPVPSGTGSLIPEPTASVAAISDGPAITPTVYTMPEG